MRHDAPLFSSIVQLYRPDQATVVARGRELFIGVGPETGTRLLKDREPSQTESSTHAGGALRYRSCNRSFDRLHG